MNLHKITEGSNQVIMPAALTKTVVHTGIYDMIRNPMSLGYYLLCVGLGLVAASTYFVLYSSARSRAGARLLSCLFRGDEIGASLRHRLPGVPSPNANAHSTDPKMMEHQGWTRLNRTPCRSGSGARGKISPSIRI